MAAAATREARPISTETRRRLSEAQRRRFAENPLTPEERAERNRRAGRRRRAELAEQLRGLDHLTDSAAGRLLGRDAKTVKRARAEFGLSSPSRARPRPARTQLEEHGA